MSKMIVMGALMAAVLLGAPFWASADSGHGHSDEGAGEEEHHGSSEGEGSSRMHSMTPADTWTKLMATRDAIAEDIERGELGDIHEKSEGLPKLASALLEQSSDLDASKRERVAGAIKQIKRLADSMHTAADGEDLAQTRKQLSRLDGILKLIQAQYPAGTLDAEMHEMSGHGDHSAVSGSGSGAHAHMQRPTGALDAEPQALVRVRASDQLRFEPRRI